MAEINKAFRVDGKVALVTGAGRGLGEAAAMALAEAGARVVVTDIALDNGSKVVEKIRAAGGEAVFVLQDVTLEAHWEFAVNAAIERYGRLDILVNNAGIETAALISESTLQEFKELMEINVTGVFLGLKQAIRAMSPGGPSGHGGSIINLSSAAGLRGYTGHTAYCTSKGAVRLMTKAAAVECAQLGLGIRVNSLHPGIINTDMGVNFIKGLVTLGLSPDMETADASVKRLFPMGHYGKPDDVANAVLYMASDASKWVTGAELSIDGGLSAA